jgi:hypothetical protein
VNVEQNQEHPLDTIRPHVLYVELNKLPHASDRAFRECWKLGLPTPELAFATSRENSGKEPIRYGHWPQQLPHALNISSAPQHQMSVSDALPKVGDHIGNLYVVLGRIVRVVGQDWA